LIKPTKRKERKERPAIFFTDSKLKGRFERLLAHSNWKGRSWKIR